METGLQGSNSILLVCLLTAVIHTVDTLSYGARVAGIRTRRLYLAVTLFSIVALAARTAHLLQAPLLGYYVDSVILLGHISLLRDSFRLIILSATLKHRRAAPAHVYTYFRHLISALETRVPGPWF